MKRSREEFYNMLNNTTDVAKQLQLVFPDPRDAIMSLGLILVSLAKSIDLPRERIIELITSIDQDLQEDSPDIDHPVH
jgi:hypothetical protein